MAANRPPKFLAEGKWLTRMRGGLRIASISVSLLFIPLAMQVPAVQPLRLQH
jgi:hypothetical protein